MHRIGIVGFGAIAEHGHLPALLALPEIEVAAVSDLSPQRLSRARELLPNVDLFDSPHDLLRHPGLTGIDICTPPTAHADLIEAACERGLTTVICEKPFVLTEDEYSRVARARARHRATVISVNNWAYSALNRTIRQVLLSSAIGTIDTIALQTGRPDAANGSAAWLPRWRISPNHSGGGIILDHGWHQLYLTMGWMNAHPVQVACLTRTVRPEHAPVEDEATIDLTFPVVQDHRSTTVPQARIELSWTASARHNAGRIVGDRGHIEIHDDRISVTSPKGVDEVLFDDRLTVSSYHADWFEAMLRSTVFSPNGDEAERNFAEAGILVATIRAAYRSADAGGVPQPVTFVSGSATAAGGVL